MKKKCMVMLTRMLCGSWTRAGRDGRCKSAGSRLEHVINQELSRDISEDREKLITTYFYKEEYLSKQIQIFHVDMHNLSCSHCNISNNMHNVLMTTDNKDKHL